MTEVYCLFRNLMDSSDGYDLLGVYTSIDKAKAARPECTWEFKSVPFGNMSGQWEGTWVDEWQGKATGKVWKIPRFYFIEPYAIDAPDKESE